jgi:DNA-binding NtrC family response regulator
VLAAMDRVVLARVLRYTRGNQTQASDLLGLHRSTLRHKLKTLGLTVDKTLTEDGQRDEPEREEGSPRNSR